MGMFTKEREEVPVTVEVSHRFESLHAHVRFNNGAIVYPGDEVLVHGRPVVAAWGEVIVEDRTGVLAQIAIAMRDAGVSVESFIQRGSSDGQALIALVTHAGEARAVDAAIAALAASPHVIGAPMRMPILDL